MSPLELLVLTVTVPIVGLRAKPGAAAAEHLIFAGEAKSLAHEVLGLVRNASSFACKAKSLAAGAPRFDRDAFGSDETGSMLGGGGQGLDLGLAGEAGGHAVPQRVQARAFAGHLEQGVAFQRRAHHVAAERRLTIVGPFQQAEQARCAWPELVEVGEIVLGVACRA